MGNMHSIELFIRIAGVSGFLAVALGAYGSHAIGRTRDGKAKTERVHINFQQGLRKKVDAKTFEDVNPPIYISKYEPTWAATYDYKVFQTANRYHFIHTLALLAAPMTRHPMVVGWLLSVGMLGFCGTCYYSALSGSTTFNRFTPYGGMTLMAGWLAMAF